MYKYVICLLSDTVKESLMNIMKACRYTSSAHVERLCLLCSDVKNVSFLPGVCQTKYLHYRMCPPNRQAAKVHMIGQVARIISRNAVVICSSLFIASWTNNITYGPKNMPYWTQFISILFILKIACVLNFPSRNITRFYNIETFQENVDRYHR